MATAPTCIIAYTSEDDRYRSVREAALDTARSAEARLILYDADAASLFSSPLPSEWSGEGSDELFPELLAPEDLERAGRHQVARQVANARANGVETYAWLPSSRGAGDLAEYAQRQHADLIMMPSELRDPGFLEKLRGISAEKAADEAGRPIALVEKDGEVQYL
jgi:hypothetical protein